MSLDVVKTAASNPARKADAPFRGWYILAVTVVTQIIAIGCTNYIYSLYMIPIGEEFGASRTVMGTGMALFLLAMGCCSPLVGKLVDKRSQRNLLVLGGVLMAVGFALMAAATALWQMAVVLVLFIAVGSSLIGHLTSATILTSWFDRYRGRAIGISAMGASLGGAVMTVVAASLIQNIGWRGSLLVIAAGIALFALLVVRFVVVDNPQRLKQYADGLLPEPGAAAAPAAGETGPVEFKVSALLRDGNFWRIALCTALVMFAGVLLSVHFVPYAAEQGIDTTAAAFVLSLFAMTGMVGKVFFGYMTDLFNAARVFCAVALVDAGAWALLLSQTSYPVFLVGVGIMGFGAGGAAPVMTSLISRCFGRRVFGRVMGCIGVLLLALIALPGPIGGLVYDLTGDYRMVFSLTFWVFPLAAVIAWFIRVPAVAPR